MSFIQCKDRNDVEKFLHTNKIKAAFITEDHRIYTEMELSDDGFYYELNAETTEALYDLQLVLEMSYDGMAENNFLTMVDAAQMLETAFKKIMKSLNYKPLKRAKK